MSGGFAGLLAAVRPVVAMTYAEARAADQRGKRLLYCQRDVLNACWDNRPDDVPGKHWGGGDSCPECTLRAAIAKATKDFGSDVLFGLVGTPAESFVTSKSTLTTAMRADAAALAKGLRLDGAKS
ncbi:hypothetical protein D9M73_65210 [compost metagenome]